VGHINHTLLDNLNICWQLSNMLKKKIMFLESNLSEGRISYKRGRGGKIKVDLDLIQFGQSKSSSSLFCVLSSVRLIDSKPSTDMAYNNSITTILSTLSHQLNSTEPQKALSVVFGTHNPESCDLVTSNLVKYGLASQVEGSTLLALRDDVVGKVFVAQLYGMSPLSDCLG
jgi:hypothetical protein